MKFYHGTSKENWEKIKTEGVLWGGYNWHLTGGKEGYRYTYLTPELKIAKKYGDVVLEVKYTPVGIDGTDGPGIDNYGFDSPPGQICWQFSVFVPITVENVKVLE